MTSTNSLNSNRFFPAFKNVFKRYFPLFIIAQILTAVFSAVISRIGADYVTETIEIWAEEGITHDITDIFVTAFPLCVMGAGIVGMFIIAFALFREVYSKRASTFFFSMPVKRGAYFNANMLFGLCTLITAFVIMVATVLISVTTSFGYQKGVLLFNTPYFLQSVTVACMCVAALYAVFMLCAVLAGKTWHYPVLCFIAVGLVNVCVTEFTSYLNNIWGFHMESSLAWIVSPTAIFSAVFNSVAEPKYFIALILQFAVVYAAGYIVFKHRKAEVAEASLSGKVVPAIMITIALLAVSFTGLAAGNVSLLGETLTNLSVLTTVCIAVVSAVILTMILTAIFYKKAFTKATAKCLAATVIITLIVVAAVKLVPDRYVNYVPAADEVESVTLDENYDYVYYNSLSSGLFEFFGAGFDYYPYYSDYLIYSFSGDEAKAKVEELHKKMIDENTINNYGSENFFYHRYYSVKLTYTLKNGRTVTRSYCVGTMDIFDEYIALMQTEEAVRQNPALSYSNEDILFIGIVDDRDSSNELNIEDYYDDDNFHIYNPEYGIYKYVALDEYSTLIENIVKDKTAEPKNVFNDYSAGFYIYDPDNIRHGDWSHYEERESITIYFYVFTDEATDEQKKLMATMSPDEMIEYDYTCNYIDYGINPLTDEYIGIDVQADVNTISYLQSVGIID